MRALEVKPGKIVEFQHKRYMRVSAEKAPLKIHFDDGDVEHNPLFVSMDTGALEVFDVTAMVYEPKQEPPERSYQPRQFGHTARPPHPGFPPHKARTP